MVDARHGTLSFGTTHRCARTRSLEGMLCVCVYRCSRYYDMWYEYVAGVSLQYRPFQRMNLILSYSLILVLGWRQQPMNVITYTW